MKFDAATYKKFLETKKHSILSTLDLSSNTKMIVTNTEISKFVMKLKQYSNKSDVSVVVFKID